MRARWGGIELVGVLVYRFFFSPFVVETVYQIKMLHRNPIAILCIPPPDRSHSVILAQWNRWSISNRHELSKVLDSTVVVARSLWWWSFMLPVGPDLFRRINSITSFGGCGPVFFPVRFFFFSSSFVSLLVIHSVGVVWLGAWLIFVIWIRFATTTTAAVEFRFQQWMFQFVV